MTDESTPHACGFVPFPGNGAYGGWFCQRKRLHFGSHRYRNYTIARIPRFWHVRQLVREFQLARKLNRYPKPGSGRRHGDYRRALYPAQYRPLPVTGHDANGAAS